MSPWDKVLESPAAQGHFVQLYESDGDALIRNVGQYLRDGIKRGDGLLVIATAEHRKAFVRELARLGADPERAVRRGQFLLLDAAETLARFMVDGEPNWERFKLTIESAIEQCATQRARMRAYGEMVGILWSARQYSAAIRLEQFWNKLLTRSSFSLFCGYPIDVFGTDLHSGPVDDLLCAHTHLLPAGADGDIERTVDRAMSEVLGPEAESVRHRIETHRRSSWTLMPRGETAILWLRNNLPKRADEILSLAREHYRALRPLPGAEPRSEPT